MIEPGNSTTSTGTTQKAVRTTVPLTVGVEEEFLLVDARTFRVSPPPRWSSRRPAVCRASCTPRAPATRWRYPPR
ncbi:hypothetical protein WKI68_30560 [Streptomyces sp. MS1.HAVA.3]|uniref:Uncharacterized protein n=1 Tax=Streptomyces caledonius TaxID=3134107 RepID=A0ABU8UAC5_9ACTN